MKSKTILIKAKHKNINAILLSPEHMNGKRPGVLWIHGGGYMLGMKEMVYFSRGIDFVKNFDAVVLSPGYRLAFQKPYPAALKDCYATLEYMWDYADELGIDRDKIVVGGESAGGGLAIATCLYARKIGKIKVAMQIPLYPMIDCDDTPSSFNNHGKVWNTKRNHWGWKHYLGKLYGTNRIPSFASPARETDYSGLPPCYTFVCIGEPFYEETKSYIAHLQAANIPAKVDVFPGNIHAFDLFFSWKEEVKQAKKNTMNAFRRIIIEGEKTL